MIKASSDTLPQMPLQALSKGKLEKADSLDTNAVASTLLSGQLDTVDKQIITDPLGVEGLAGASSRAYGAKGKSSGLDSALKCTVPAIGLVSGIVDGGFTCALLFSGHSLSRLSEFSLASVTNPGLAAGVIGAVILGIVGGTAGACLVRKIMKETKRLGQHFNNSGFFKTYKESAAAKHIGEKAQSTAQAFDAGQVNVCAPKIIDIDNSVMIDTIRLDRNIE